MVTAFLYMFCVNCFLVSGDIMQYRGHGAVDMVAAGIPECIVIFPTWTQFCVYWSRKILEERDGNGLACNAVGYAREVITMSAHFENELILFQNYIIMIMEHVRKLENYQRLIIVQIASYMADKGT